MILVATCEASALHAVTIDKPQTDLGQQSDGYVIHARRTTKCKAEASHDSLCN